MANKISVAKNTSIDLPARIAGAEFQAGRMRVGPFGKLLQKWALLDMPRVRRDMHVGKAQELLSGDLRYFQAIKFRRFRFRQHSLHCSSYGSLSPITQGGRLNAGSQKKEVPVSSSDVSINGVSVLNDFPAMRIWFRFYSQGLGNDGARLHHDSARFYDA